jgi:hypothetical protein
MSEWTSDELSKIGAAEEVHIAARRPDGTLRTPVTVWVVPVGDSLYARSVKGSNAAWFRGVQQTHEGRISAGGVEKDVTFVEADHEIDDEVDAAYRRKYRRYAGSILNSVLTPEARSTTIKLVPRPTRS